MDGLVDLLLPIVHRISVRAAEKVGEEWVGALQQGQGKPPLL
jgi:hypothetical protein